MNDVADTLKAIANSQPKEHIIILYCKSCDVNMAINIEKVNQTISLVGVQCLFCKRPLDITIAVKIK